MNRRSFLGIVNVTLGGLMGAVVALPIVGGILDPLLRRKDASKTHFVDVGPIDRFPKETVTPAVLMHSEKDGWVQMPPRPALGVFVIRGKEDADIQVFSRVCPHLGCSIQVRKESGFHCPCHNSQFATSGERVELSKGTNPAPRDMDSLEHRIRAGRLEVMLMRFRTGTAEQEVVA